MASLDHLLSEAERIRGEYKSTDDAAVRAKLIARYQEIDRMLGELRSQPPAQKSRPKSNVLNATAVKTDSLATELLTLCQSITADGAISDAEIGQLRSWLTIAEGSDVPAVAFLRDVVSLVLKDGVVTEEERNQLYAAIETVLPPDLRKFAKQRRKLVIALEKEQARKQREIEKELQRLERDAARPLYDADFMVAGVPYEGRAAVVAQHVYDGMNVFLVREPRNQFSPYATGVVLGNGLQIGYIPEEEAEEFAPLLDRGYPYQAFIKKVLTGGRIPIPVVVASVHASNAPISGLVTQQNNPTVVQAQQKRGWFGR